MLGIVSTRPEFERGKGPDNLWAVGDNTYLVIECKNGTITETINKHDCNQLNGSIVWFENEYIGNGSTCCPIMIHNSDKFDHACSPNTHIRIMTPTDLDKFKTRIKNFSRSLVQLGTYKNAISIQELLQQFKLLGNMLFNEYTTGYRVE